MRYCNLPCSVPSGAVMSLVAPAKWIKGMGVLTTASASGNPILGLARVYAESLSPRYEPSQTQEMGLYRFSTVASGAPPQLLLPR